MPIIVALLAGGLAILNPCGFAMLPAFLSLYVGAQDQQLPAAPTRALQGLLVGLLVTTGFLTVFGVLGLPIALGAGQVVRAVPWIGLALGTVLGAMALATLAGKRLELRLRAPQADTTQRRPATMVVFGMGYGLASLGCTLPIFLAVIGASLATSGALAALVVFAAYALGMAIVLMALSVGAALLRTRLARTLGTALPHLRWINGGLLLLVAVYLVYYWGMALFASATTRADDPVVGFMDTITATVQRWIDSGGGWWLLAGALAVIATAILIPLWRWVIKTDTEPDDIDAPAAIPRGR